MLILLAVIYLIVLSVASIVCAMAVFGPNGLDKDSREVRKEIAAVTIFWPLTLAFFIGKGLVWVFGACVDLVVDVVREMFKK